MMVRVLLTLSDEIVVHQLVPLKGQVQNNLFSYILTLILTDSIQQICYHENLNMAGLACGVYVNITMVMLSSHVQDEDSKYTCQETAELIVSTIVALTGGTELPSTSILKVTTETHNNVSSDGHITVVAE